MATNGEGAAQPVIPIINISSLSDPSASPTSRQHTGTALLSALTTSGFAYLSAHPVSPSTLSRVYELSAAFFRMPASTKDTLEWDTPEANRGYTTMGREKVTNAETRDEAQAIVATEGADLKESFEIGREHEGPGLENKWPPLEKEDELGITGFRRDMQAFHAQMKELHVQIMRALALGFGIDEAYFDQFTRLGDNTLRLLHYPPAKKALFPARIRAGAHSDYGSITLLFQDDRGGLQVKSPEGKWVDATPIEGTIVLNAGDLLARWSNGRIKSTLHRVVEPPATKAQMIEAGALKPATDAGIQGEGETVVDGNVEIWHPARYSVAYFCNPDFDRWIEAIPGTVADGEKARFEGVNSGDYLVRRLTATY